MYNTEASTIGFITILNALEPIIIIILLIIIVVCCMRLGEIKDEYKELNIKMDSLESFWKLLNETNKILINSNTIQHETYKILKKENNNEDSK